MHLFEHLVLFYVTDREMIWSFSCILSFTLNDLRSNIFNLNPFNIVDDAWAARPRIALHWLVIRIELTRQHPARLNLHSFQGLQRNYK